MTSIDRKRRKAGEKRKKVRPPKKRRYRNLIIVAPFIVFVGILVLIYGPFGDGTASDFTLTDVQGRGTFTLNAHRGKVVIIEFFSTDCSSCHTYISTLQQIRTLYSKAELTMISISVPRAKDTENLLRTYAAENGITWYIALDTGTVTADYKVRSTPTTVLVDKNGKIAFKQSGVLSSAVLRTEIDLLL